jgi:hypothetical protein
MFWIVLYISAKLCFLILALISGHIIFLSNKFTTTFLVMLNQGAKGAITQWVASLKSLITQWVMMGDSGWWVIVDDSPNGWWVILDDCTQNHSIALKSSGNPRKYNFFGFPEKMPPTHHPVSGITHYHPVGDKWFGWLVGEFWVLSPIFCCIENFYEYFSLLLI